MGESTASGLRARGIEADLIPPKFQSAALLPLLDENQKGIRTAVIRAVEGSEELIDELRRRGGEVDLAIAYQTRRANADASALPRADAITFTSASTVDHFFEAIGENVKVLDGARIASIGPITSAAIRRWKREPDAEAEEATVGSLCDAVVRMLSR